MEKIIASFIAQNLAFRAYANIINNKGKYSFLQIDNYMQPEQFDNLTKQECRLLDTYNLFTSAKNAAYCFAHCLETKSELSQETFDKQRSITPTDETFLALAKGLRSFRDLLNIAPEHKTFLLSIAEAYNNLYYSGAIIFDIMHLNGSNGLNTEMGTQIIAHDPATQAPILGEVIIASPGGVITACDIDGILFTVTNNHKAKVITMKELGEVTSAKLKAAAAKTAADLQEDKGAVTGRIVKKAEAAAKKAADAAAKKEVADKKAADKKAAADKAANEAKTTFATLQAMQLDSPEKVDEAVKQLNAVKLEAADHTVIKDRIKAAKAQFKADEKAAKDKKAADEKAIADKAAADKKAADKAAKDAAKGTETKPAAPAAPTTDDKAATKKAKEIADKMAKQTSTKQKAPVVNLTTSVQSARAAKQNKATAKK